MVLGEGNRDPSVLVVRSVLTRHAFHCALSGIGSDILYCLVLHYSSGKFLLGFIKTGSCAPIDFVYLKIAVHVHVCESNIYIYMSIQFLIGISLNIVSNLIFKLHEIHVCHFSLVWRSTLTLKAFQNTFNFRIIFSKKTTSFFENRSVFFVD